MEPKHTRGVMVVEADEDGWSLLIFKGEGEEWPFLIASMGECSESEANACRLAALWNKAEAELDYRELSGDET